MQGFRTKLLLPLILLVLSIGAFMELYWLPNWETQLVEEHLQQEQEYLQLLGAVLRNPLQASDMAAIYDVLDQLAVDKTQWDTLLLTRSDGLVLYPIGSAETLVDSAYWVTAAVEFEGDQLAQLRVLLDLDAFLAEERARINMLELILLSVALLAALLIGWMQKHLVLGPIDNLADVAHSIAQGDFYSPIPTKKTHERGVGEFFQAFRVMRESIAEQIEERQVAERRLNDSQRVARLGCWEWNPLTESFWCSDSLLPIMHLADDEAFGRDGFFSHIHPTDAGKVKRDFERIQKKGGAFEAEFRVNTPDGLKYVNMIGQHDWESGRTFGTCQDVTDRKDIESSLRKLSSAITYSGSSVMITDIVGTIEYVNPKYTEATGFQLHELLGEQPEILSRKWMAPDKYDDLWKSILDGRNWRGELQSLCKDGSTFWSLVSISPIKNEFSELTHFVIVLEDVTELKNAHARMEQLALYDELTGLANRRLFYTQLRQLLDQVDQGLCCGGAVMLLDLDFFKTINDTRGHQIGDELLKAVAKRLSNSLKEQDVAARLGGDEFALLLSPIDGKESVEPIAERILQALSRPFLIDDTELQVTTSLGIALMPKDGEEPDSLLKHADLAMYQAKEKGRNQYRFFTESLHEQLQTYIRFTREMPVALDRGEFVLNFQPQVDLNTGRIIGAEALIRWQHPELGLVPPPNFIAVAEETGFIVTLGRWVAYHACQALRALKAAGYDDLRIAINLSARQFRDPQLISMIGQVAQDAGVDTHLLEIEITETLLMHDVDRAINTLQALRSLGMSIAIDDFGIGYSSFNYLKTLPIDVLKVDREFIKDIPQHLDDMEITAAIISMAHRLNLKVVAEGIETDIQQVFLEEHHCDYGQGYLFSRPVSLDEFMLLLPPPERKDKRELAKEDRN